MYKFLLLILITSCVSPSKIQVPSILPAESLIPVGRTDLKPGNLELISSGAYFGFTFTGKTCSLYLSIPSWLERNYIQYTIDGKYGERIQLTRDSSPIVIKAPTAGNHEVWIYKTTEAHTGGVFVNRIVATGIKSIQPASKPMIEFIGNSITCGAAADPSQIPCGQGSYHDQHNAYYAYGPRVARALNTHYLLNSVSGIGIYRNWNSDGPDMPDVYDHNDFKPGGSPYPYNQFSPGIISIALGTNDLSNGDGKKPRLPFDSATYVNDYVRFVKKLHQRTPGAKIALLSSPMMNGERRILLQNCISAVKQQLEPEMPGMISLHFFQPMKAKGCTGHPDVQDHEVMANELVPFFKKLLNP